MRRVRSMALVLTLVGVSCGQGQQQTAASASAASPVDTIDTEAEVATNVAEGVDSVQVDAVQAPACSVYAQLMLDEEAARLPYADPDWMTEMRSTLHELAPDTANAWDQVVQAETDAGPRSDWIPFAAKLDQTTFELCGLPLLSALQQVDGYSFSCNSSGPDSVVGHDGDEDCVTARANFWPCFTLADPSQGPYANQPAASRLDYYQAIDCDSGAPVEAGPGSVWTVFDPQASTFTAIEE